MGPRIGTHPAPLAQLRNLDETLWRKVWASYHPDPVEGADGPGTETVTQALSASLLGDRKLAVEILTEGFYARALRPWPDLGPKPRR